MILLLKRTYLFLQVDVVLEKMAKKDGNRGDVTKVFEPLSGIQFLVTVDSISSRSVLDF